MAIVKSLVLELIDQRSQSSIVLQKIIAISLRGGWGYLFHKNKFLSLCSSNSTKEAVAKFFHEKHIISSV